MTTTNGTSARADVSVCVGSAMRVLAVSASVEMRGRLAVSVRAAGARQRHIDQAQSVNLYITNEYTMRQVLNLYIQAWEEGVKTIYYVRSKALEVEECESCSS